jgi:hypothetical protein
MGGPTGIPDRTDFHFDCKLIQSLQFHINLRPRRSSILFGHTQTTAVVSVHTDPNACCQIVRQPGWCQPPSLRYLTHGELRFSGNAAIECQSSNASHGRLHGHERIGELLCPRGLPVARGRASAQFIKLHIRYCSRRSLKLFWSRATKTSRGRFI